MTESRPYILKLIHDLDSSWERCEEEAQQWIDSFGKLGYIPVEVRHGNSFKDVTILILFKKGVS